MLLVVDTGSARPTADYELAVTLFGIDPDDIAPGAGTCRHPAS
jgi:hypothetical protein